MGYLFKPSLLFGVLLLVGPAVADESAAKHDVLIFPDLNGVHSFSGSDTDEDLFAGVNLLYSYTSTSVRVLLEYAASNEEHEVERLQVGWAFEDGPIIWAGRVHNPDNYWNTTFHHGQYLQTSISRPWISRFEDEGGPLLAHTTGMLIELADHSEKPDAWNAYLSVGAGAHLEENLEPFDLFSPSADHGLAVHGRVAYLPDFLGQNQLGLVGSYDEIEVIDAPGGSMLTAPDSIRQFSVGAYADWHWGGTRAISEFRYIRNDFQYQDSVNEDLLSFYAFLEHRFSDAWVVFGRLDLVDGNPSRYLALTDDSIKEQWMGGVRWDFSRRQALTLEVQKKVTVDSELDRQNVQLQWSAVFP